MDFIYYLAIIALGFLIFVGPFALLGAVLKPSTINKATGKDYSRKQIGGIGFMFGSVLLVALVAIGMATEPKSAKADLDNTNQIQKESKKITKETSLVKSPIPFETIKSDDPTISKGEEKITQEGMNGEKVHTYEITYTDGIETNRKLIKEEITKTPTNKRVFVGTYVAPVQPLASNSISYVSSSSNSSSAVYYENCTQAREAGAAPIYAGQPGYHDKLDRDRDGIACEVE